MTTILRAAVNPMLLRWARDAPASRRRGSWRVVFQTVGMGGWDGATHT